MNENYINFLNAVGVKLSRMPTTKRNMIDIVSFDSMNDMWNLNIRYKSYDDTINYTREVFTFDEDKNVFEFKYSLVEFKDGDYSIYSEKDC